MAGAPSATLLVVAVYLAIQSAVLNLINTAVTDDYMVRQRSPTRPALFCRRRTSLAPARPSFPAGGRETTHVAAACQRPGNEQHRLSRVI